MDRGKIGVGLRTPTLKPLDETERYWIRSQTALRGQNIRQIVENLLRYG